MKSTTSSYLDPTQLARKSRRRRDFPSWLYLCLVFAKCDETHQKQEKQEKQEKLNKKQEKIESWSSTRQGKTGNLRSRVAGLSGQACWLACSAELDIHETNFCYFLELGQCFSLMFFLFFLQFLLFFLLLLFFLRNPPPALPETDFFYFLQLGQCYQK